MNRDEIITRVGAEDWNQVVEWFIGMSGTEVLDSCNDIWPIENNTELAQAIYEEVNRQEMNKGSTPLPGRREIGPT